MGARQSVGGGASFASWNSLKSFSTWGGSMLTMRVRLVTPIFSQKALAVAALTRQNLSCRKEYKVPPSPEPS